MLDLTLSPVPPDQFLQSVDTDDKRIKDTALILGRNVPLSQILLIYAVGMACAGATQQQVYNDDRAAGGSESWCLRHGSRQIGRGAYGLSCLRTKEGRSGHVERCRRQRISTLGNESWL
jgi:hypothetical protein